MRKPTKQQPQDKKRQPPANERKRDSDSDDIERAVYDGMQDLRAARSPQKKQR